MNCRACGSGSLVLVFEMEPMPLAGGFALTREAALAAPKYPIEWHRCTVCGLVNVYPDIPDADIFTDYSYRASDVPALVRHHTAFAAWLAERFPETVWYLEIGSNDGVLIDRLPDSWLRDSVDPSDVGDPTVREPFTSELVRRMGWQGRYDLITSSNAFAHFTGIGDALDGVRDALAPDGRFVIEVHDLDATITSGQWDTVYHEHKVEWSLSSLVAAGSLHGLWLIDRERLALHGGLLRATFRKSQPLRLTAPPAPAYGRLAQKYRNRHPVGATAAYGAAARATVYLNQTGEDVEYIVDASPRRYGRFVPGTGTPVVPPAHFDANQPDRTLITAWTQADDIKAAHPRYRGEWVTAW